jgi:hypothetical protein
LPIVRCLALLAAVAMSLVVVALVPAFATSTAFAVLVILVKTLGDLRLHARERQAFEKSRRERSAAG